MASAAALRAEARALLVRMAMTSTTPARGLLVAGSRRPGSDASWGTSEHPAQFRALELERAGDHVEEIERVIERARGELEATVRRRLADLHPDSYVDLAAQIVDRGEGWPVRDVAIAMRTTPTLVRRMRLTAGRDAEYGRPLALEQANGSPTVFAAQLLEAGYSVRAAALIVGMPKSTLANRVRRGGPG